MQESSPVSQGGLFGAAVLFSQSGTPRAAVAGYAEPAPAGLATRALSAAQPLSSTFTYQGQLTDAGNAVNATCGMAFRLYDDPAAGIQIGDPVTASVAVSNGIFTAGLDFGNSAFDGNGRWLDLRVDCGAGYVALTPRQALTAAPYA